MSGAEPALVAAVIGTAGIADGEAYVLTDGIEIFIGRSRNCQIPLSHAA